MISGLALAAVITVRPGGPVASLTAALGAARSGDTIVVTAGTYREPAMIDISLPVTILGQPGATLEGGEHGILRVTAPGVVIEGLTFRDVRPSNVDDRAAIRLEGATGCAVRGNRVSNAFFGIYAAKAADCRIEDNVIEGPGRGEQTSGNAIHLWSSTGMTIADNVVTGHRDGIYLEFVRESELRGNTSRENQRYGLHFMFSDSCRYVGNTFAHNGAGVAVMYTKRVTMDGNRFAENQGQAAYGLLLKDISDSRLEGNEFAANTIGLYLEGANRVLVRGNRFGGNGWAAKVLANSIDDRFEENTFVGNAFDVTTNARSTGTTFRRNYWDRYRGYDLDRDGVGDVPFRPVRLFSLIVENTEPALVLLRSLFVDLLDAAERVLPILTPETLVDSEPLIAAPR
jgi:nitrous oxidase accessory protein